MNKKIIWTLSAIMTLSCLSVYSAGIEKLEPINPPASNLSQSGSANTSSTFSSASSGLDKNTIYYPNANIKSAIAKYKAGNYTGCLQELFSLTKKDPSNALAYYYMAMAYTHVNMKDDAISAYEKVLSLNPNASLVQYATKGRDCLTGGPACKPPEQQAEQMDELDKFINAPYGNGLSPELTEEVKQNQLKNIQQTINTKEDLEKRDIQRIKNFDTKNKSSIDSNDKIAQVSDEEVLKAIKTLKEAGLNLSVQSDNPYAQMMQYQDPRMMEISMMLGNNNNNNNGNMMNMLPMLMSQAQKGENIDPRLMQAMMMNSMMSDFSFSNNDNKY